MKRLLFIILIINLILFGCATSTNTSLKEYRLNADKYVNQIITIQAKVVTFGSPDVDILSEYGVSTFFYEFVDDEGYFVNVITEQRSFEIDNVYTVTGKYIKTSRGNYYLIEELTEEDILPAKEKEAVSGATDQQKEIWRGQCKLYCSLGQKENFVSKKFRSESGDEYGCKTTLDVTCGVCTGAEAGCAQQRDSAKCKAAGCLWEAW